MSGNKEFNFKTIGFVESAAKYRYELPRQAVFSAGRAFLRWTEKIYRECAADLHGFDRVWLIWVFDRNENGKFRTKARVPVPAEKDTYSVFATRSPYRPNPIGISAVELIDITDDGLLLGACDLLDGTAVLDVKPYIPDVDSFPQSKAGWRDRIDKNPNKIIWHKLAAKQADFILEHGNFDLRNFCNVQLTYRPLDFKGKRVEKSEKENVYILHFRTWKINFCYDSCKSEIFITDINSNYSADDLAEKTPDKYMDKNIHRAFINKFKNSEFNCN